MCNQHLNVVASHTGVNCNSSWWLGSFKCDIFCKAFTCFVDKIILEKWVRSIVIVKSTTVSITVVQQQSVNAHMPIKSLEAVTEIVFDLLQLRFFLPLWLENMFFSISAELTLIQSETVCLHFWFSWSGSAAAIRKTLTCNRKLSDSKSTAASGDVGTNVW